MSLLAIDLGGTKLAVGLFNEKGDLLFSKEETVAGRQGKQVFDLIFQNIFDLANADFGPVSAIGVSVPGISNHKNGTVWAPNIPGWDNYPLLKELNEICGNIPVSVESDRSCYILGEMWKGNAKGCNNAIFLAVGTGIGAGIVVDGHLLHGANDIIGAVGWMALERPFREDYVQCGCFEHHASGNGITKMARQLIAEDKAYSGVLKNKIPGDITSHDVFKAFDSNDQLAQKVINKAIVYWGMAIANLISIFNPEKILLGGGIFGPAVHLIPAIRNEALKWAQPVSALQVSIEPSLLGTRAGMYGAGFIAQQLNEM